MVSFDEEEKTARRKAINEIWKTYSEQRKNQLVFARLNVETELLKFKPDKKPDGIVSRAMSLFGVRK